MHMCTQIVLVILHASLFFLDSYCVQERASLVYKEYL